MTVVGVDVGGTKILAAAFGDRSTPPVQVEDATPAGSVRDLVAAITKAVETVHDQMEGGPLTGVGIGVPGRVDTLDGTVRGALNLGLGAEPLALAALVGSRVDAYCRIDNDVNCAALGAYELMHDRLDDDELVYLSIGTGLAAGVVLGGDVRRGHRGLAGEIGHVRTGGALPCACGLSGCLEAAASGAAIAQRWPAANGMPPALALVAAAEQGDVDALCVLAEIAGHLADAAHVLAVTYDVEPIVIGGGVADAGEPLLDAIREVLRERERASGFARALGLSGRLHLKPAGPVGAIGAAALVRGEAP